MKIRVTFKTPDAVDEAIQEKWDVEDMPDREELDATIDQFVRYGEYVTIEFDTDTQTAKVVPL